MNIFSNVRGMPGGCPGGMLAAGIDSHIILIIITITIIIIINI